VIRASQYTSKSAYDAVSIWDSQQVVVDRGIGLRGGDRREVISGALCMYMGDGTGGGGD